MGRKALAIGFVLLIAGCSASHGSGGAPSQRSASSTSQGASIEPSLDQVVATYLSGLVSGDREVSYAFQSHRCQAKVNESAFGRFVDSVHARYESLPFEPMKYHLHTSAHGDVGVVSYDLKTLGVHAHRERWRLDGDLAPSWVRDEC